MVIASRHRLIGAVVLAAAALSVGGCQNALDVGAVNRCASDIEIQADSVRKTTARWITVGGGVRNGVVQVGESIETLYVNVRAPGRGGIRSFDVPITSLGRPPASADYQAELVLGGDRCP